MFPKRKINKVWCFNVSGYVSNAWGHLLKPEGKKTLRRRFSMIPFLFFQWLGITFWGQRLVFLCFGLTFGGQRVTFGCQGITFWALRGHFLSSEVDSEAVWNSVRKQITNSQNYSDRNYHFWRISRLFGRPKTTKKRSKIDTRNHSNFDIEF